jgi:hypothetical protein
MSRAPVIKLNSRIRRAVGPRPHSGVVALALKKSVMGTALDDPAGIHDEDLIAGNDALEPMRHEDDRAPALERSQRFQEKVLMVRIKGAGRLIEDEKWRA